MALVGKKRSFAEAIVAAKPERISNRAAALEIGCSAKCAAASGSRWARDADVRAFIASCWPEYYDPPPAKEQNTTAIQNGLPFFCADDVAAWLRYAKVDDVQAVACAVLEVMPEAWGITAPKIKAWLEQADTEGALFCEIVQAFCRRLGATTNPLQYWDSVLMNQHASPKEKQAAAEAKAKYTLAKPAAQNKKEAELEQAQRLRYGRRLTDGGAPLFEAATVSGEETGGHAAPYKGQVPVWTN
ncbi:hypothetical protein [Eikenella sp. NML99-0057]|uniref:hypothetical protein n=1 Tax=Eikenella sp. NML99-0057 TaxID=1795834 RepID=UPI000A6D9AD7|nr:hypothetical protein [Eikenella sp. NML99-0057]